MPGVVPKPGAMTVIPLPARGYWAWDARGEGRAVRVSTHGETGVLNVSLWRGEVCVGTVRLPPDEVSRLVAGLTAGLAQLADRPVPEQQDGAGPDGARLLEVEQRLAALEARARPRARPALRPLARDAAGALRSWRRRRAARRG